MKFFFTFLLTCFFILQVTAQSSFKLCSWNIANFGKSKTPEDIAFIAKTIDEFDIVSIVEVVAGEGGPKAVEALKKVLNKNGKKWDCAVSEPTTTTGSGTERYAIFWKIASVKRITAPQLETVFKNKIDREPFFVGFKLPNGRTFTVAAFHAVPTAKKPEKEIKLLGKIPDSYPKKNIIFCGDFNLEDSHEAFDVIKSEGYATVFNDQKTSLKMECDDGDDCLASVYDNILFRSSKVETIRSGVIKFYEDISPYSKARKLSDHIPVFAEFSMN